MSFYRGVLGLLAIACWACHDPAYGGPEYDVRPERTETWSGGRFQLYSAAFEPPALPAFAVDGQYLARYRRDDTTFAVSLPDRPGERIPITVLFPDDTVQVGPITLRGFSGASLGPPLKGTPRIWPAPPNVLLVGPEGLVQYDVGRNAIARTWPDSLHDPRCNVSAGVSYRSPNHVVLQRRASTGACGPPVSWDLWPEPAPVDSALWGCCAWALVEMAPGRWLVARDDFFVVLDCQDGTCPVQRQFRRMTTELAILSPRGDRVALPGWSATGPYVLDPASGDTAYSLPLFWIGEHATFSPDGDTLLMTGYLPAVEPGSISLTLARLRAADGSLIDSLALPPGFSASAVALDPLADLIYVAGLVEVPDLEPPPDDPWPYRYEPALLVLRRNTLEPVALLHVPAADDPYHPNPAGDLSVVASPADGHVYVLLVPWSYDAPTAPVLVYRFDRVP